MHNHFAFSSFMCYVYICIKTCDKFVYYIYKTASSTIQVDSTLIDKGHCMTIIAKTFKAGRRKAVNSGGLITQQENFSMVKLNPMEDS